MSEAIDNNIPSKETPASETTASNLPEDKAVDRALPSSLQSQEPAGHIPHAKVRKMRWPFPVVWIVPVLAACLTGYYVYVHHQENGATITIQFDDVAGVKAGETTIALHGVTLGHVKSVELTGDHAHAITHVQLETSAVSIAKAETIFWLVKPEVSIQNVTGLNTLVSGPYIDCKPGGGEATNSFVAVPGAPKLVGAGLSLILSADQIAQLSVDSPVNYRGIQVGVVKDIRLSSAASAVNVTVYIWERYRSLVRSNSEFWMIKAADLQGSLLGGLKLQLASVQNILTGGVTFATPELNYGEFVKDGATFELHDQPRDEWLKWRPQIQLPAAEGDGSDQKAAAAQRESLPTVKKN